MAKFEPGQSGNPGGRAKMKRGFLADIRQATRNGKDLLNIALAVAHDPDSTNGEKLKAVEWLADRGWGKSVQFTQLEVSKLEEDPKYIEPGSLSPAELNLLIELSERQSGKLVGAGSTVLGEWSPLPGSALIPFPEAPEAPEALSEIPEEYADDDP